MEKLQKSNFCNSSKTPNPRNSIFPNIGFAFMEKLRKSDFCNSRKPPNPRNSIFPSIVFAFLEKLHFCSTSKTAKMNYSGFATPVTHRNKGESKKLNFSKYWIRVSGAFVKISFLQLLLRSKCRGRCRTENRNSNVISR